MYRIVIDQSLCSGFGECADLAPDVFELEDSGRAFVRLGLPAFVVTLVKTILILKGVDQNWAQVIQGTLIIVVVMIGGLAIRQRRRT